MRVNHSLFPRCSNLDDSAWFHSPFFASLALILRYSLGNAVALLFMTGEPLYGSCKAASTGGIGDFLQKTRSLGGSVRCHPCPKQHLNFVVGDAKVALELLNGMLAISGSVCCQSGSPNVASHHIQDIDQLRDS